MLLHTVKSITWEGYKPSIEPEDTRIGHHLMPLESIEFLKPSDIVILGIPQDIGVQRNGGRKGAQAAPMTIRKALQRLSDYGLGNRGSTVIYDAGDIVCEGYQLEEIREMHYEVVSALLLRNARVIVLGGGHDIAFPNAQAMATVFQQYAVMNIDPHLDVRERVEGLTHSGTPFREMLELCPPIRFTEFGTQDFSASLIHRRFVEQKGGNIVSFHEMSLGDSRFQRFKNEIALLLSEASQGYISFDIDSIASAFAPGVSAPASIGFTSEEFCMMAYHAAHSGARLIDFVEVNPEYDRDEQTSRLVANAIAWTMKGWIEGSITHP